MKIKRTTFVAIAVVAAAAIALLIINSDAQPLHPDTVSTTLTQ